MERTLSEKPSVEEVPQSGTAGIILNGRYLPPPTDKDGKQWVRTNALILKPASELYELWRDVEKAPLWQEQIAEVRATGPRTSHWVMLTGDDPNKSIEWDSEILKDEPGKRIAWSSIGGDSDNAGEVIFETAPDGRGTIVTVLQEFRMSKLASAWETLTGRNPKQAVIENLRHFKALAETGEIPRVQGHSTELQGFYDKVKTAVMLETDRPIVLRQAIQAVRKGGTVSIPGVYGGLLDKVPFGAAFGKGIMMKMGQTNMHNYMHPLLERVEKGQIDPSSIISHRITLDQAPEMYKVWREKRENVTHHHNTRF